MAMFARLCVVFCVETARASLTIRYTGNLFRQPLVGLSAVRFSICGLAMTWLATICILHALGGQPATTPEEPKRPAAASADEKQIANWLAEFRAAKRDANKRSAAANRLLRLGPEGAEPLRAEIESQ